METFQYGRRSLADRRRRVRRLAPSAARRTDPSGFRAHDDVHGRDLIDRQLDVTYCVSRQRFDRRYNRSRRLRRPYPNDVVLTTVNKTTTRIPRL